MTTTPDQKFRRLRSSGSRQVADDPDQLVDRQLLDGATLPLVITPRLSGVDLASWLASSRSAVTQDLHRHGAVLFRGFGCDTPERFSEAVAACTDELVEFPGGAAIRTRVDGKVFTSSEYPNELDIRLHSEFCYSSTWPMKLFFCCIEAPVDCGQTPLVDNRALYRAMPADIRETFAALGVRYLRGYGYNRTWQRSYETDDRADVEEICRNEGRTVEWVGDDELRTWETRPAVATHPVTGEDLWFNFAHGFHVSRMDEGIRSALSEGGDADDLNLWPNNAFYGDGSPIPDDVVAWINATVEAHAVDWSWERGDLVMVDNMLVAHGRRPYTGPRRVLLQMAEAHTGFGGD